MDINVPTEKVGLRGRVVEGDGTGPLTVGP